ncbi:MAG: right-handed parallel beta-helix repeat-containing protein, partial [Chloroflexi bacterium]|nr:right-handed parallel beta-helix repeat-containing protein [Chloroflexota bacterium]
YVDNCYFDFTTGLCTLYSGGSGVTLNGVNTFIGNAFEGLRVWSGGAIAVSNVAAHGNGFSGSRAASTYVDPDAIPANGDEFYAYDAEGKGVFLHNFGAASAKPVTVSGTNIFSNNASSGLFVYTKGFFTGNNLTASFNGCNPAFDIADQYCAGVFIYSESGVKQTGYASFSSNNREGLEVWNNVRGWVWLNNLDAQGNGTSSQSGVYVQAYNPALAIPVAITGVNFFRGNNYNGLHINASGAVSLYNATSNSNIGGSGISVDNRSPFKAPVTFLGLTSTESNGANGFDIYSYGAVTTYGVYSRMNFASGAYIDNCDGAMSCSAPAALPVTMNGDNFFISNVDTNLWVNSRGAITVNNLTAHFSSTGNGAYLNNRYSNAAAPVTLKGYARASNNQLDNIVIYSNGAVSAANVTANNSLTLYGMYIQNDTALMPGVILTGYNTFNNNKGIGIYIRSYGAVFASNLTASYNGNPNPSYGAQIINNGGPAPRPVTISGVNTFNGNFSSGLFVNSYGAITVSNVTAKYNSNGSGVVLYNQHGLYIQPVTISVYGVFEGNASDGLSVESNGNVTMANLTGNNNQGYGVFVNSSNAGASSVSANVTLTGNNFFRGNVSGSGLYITNDGNITVSNVTALSNGFYGARLDNSTLAGVGEVKNIAVNGVNNFYFNAGLAGLGVFSSGGATLTRIQSGSNYDSGGATTNGLYANVVGTLTLSCGKFTGNEGAGYNLNAAVVKLLGFLSNNNGAADWVAAGMVTQTKVCPLP